MIRHNLTPHYILERAARGQRLGSLDAACLFVDISGFTPLTVALMAHGTEGAEVLAEVLVAVLEPLIDFVYLEGGFIAGFAGDAFKALFPVESENGDTPSDVQRRALTAAWQIRQCLANNPTQSTRFGDYAFSGKACVAYGPVTWHIWRDSPGSNREQRAAAVFSGEGISRCMAIDSHADAGEVVVTRALCAGLPDGALITSRVGDYLRVEAIHLEALTHSVPAELWAAQDFRSLAHAAATDFYPEWLLKSTLQGEFRQTVTMFVNFEHEFSAEESTAFQTLLFRLVDRYDAFLGRVGQIGGKDNGNTLLLFWGAPTGSEQDVERALRFILDLQANAPARLRAGITTHLAYAGFVGSTRSEEYTCYGSYVNLAARQLVAAQWDEIWLDGESTRQADKIYRTQPMGERHFKGFAQPQSIFLLQGRQSNVQRAFYSGSFVGRKRELGQMFEVIQPIFDGQFAGLLAVEGEAGVGKSRLVHEFENVTATLERAPQWFRCQTDEILRQPLNPFRYWLRRYFDQIVDSDENDRLRRFHMRLDALIAATGDAELVAELERKRSFFAALIDLYWDSSPYDRLEPQLRHDNMLEAIKSLIKAESLQRPTIVQLEDIQWLDEESAQFVTQLLRNVAGYPFVVIATSRPRKTDSAAAQTPLKLPKETSHHWVSLTKLESAGIQEMATDLLGGPPTPDLLALLVQRADGNPFFVEQLLLYLREQNRLKQSEDGWQVVGGRDDLIGDVDASLPTDVRALLSARLDRLEPAVKEVVQTASVLGREFDVTVLRSMLSSDMTLDHKLTAADDALIWIVTQETTYLFRHALLRDAAYDMQLRGRLRQLHGLAANAVKEVHAADLPPRYADLAYHYRHSEERDPEQKYARLAGEHAVEKYANRDAARHFERALALTPTNETKQQYELLLHCEGVYNRIGDRSNQSGALKKLQELSEESQDQGLHANVNLRISHYERTVNDYPRALKAIHLAIASAADSGNLALEAEGYHAWGRLQRKENDYAAARISLERALTLHRRIGNVVGEADSLYDLAVVSWYKGNLERAFDFCDRARMLYEQVDMLQGQVFSLDLYGSLARESGQFMEAQQFQERALAKCREIGVLSDEARILAGLGDSHLELGDFESAEDYHTRALELCREIGERDGEAIGLDCLSLICYLRGDHEMAINYGSTALSIQEEINDRRSMGYTLTYLGNASVAAGDLAKGEVYHRQALALRIDLGEESRTVDNLAALAELALSQDNSQDATALALKSLTWMDNYGLGGVEFPVQVYLSCYRVLASEEESATGYAHAYRALRAGYFLVRERAEAIGDSKLANLYVQNIPFNREVIRLWEDVGERLID